MSAGALRTETRYVADLGEQSVRGSLADGRQLLDSAPKIFDASIVTRFTAALPSPTN
jgi:hypothetical protein